METADESPIRWPKQETRDSQRRKYPAKRRYRIRLKWVFILAVATLLWIGMIATGYAIWQSGNVLTLARFVFNLL
jgi:cytochrome b subunit of formate dehydrogenase